MLQAWQLKKASEVVFESACVIIESKSEKVAEGIRCTNNICCLYFRVVTMEAHANSCEFQELHESLGHINQGTLKNGAIDGIDRIAEKNIFCEGCIRGKMHGLPYKENKKNMSTALEKVFMQIYVVPLRVHWVTLNSLCC